MNLHEISTNMFVPIISINGFDYTTFNDRIVDCSIISDFLSSIHTAKSHVDYVANMIEEDEAAK